jgi:hypothetical protein
LEDKIETNKENLLGRLEAKIETNRETDQEERKAEEKAYQEDLKKMMEEMLRANQDKMDTWLIEKQDGRKETTACHEATKADAGRTEPEPGVMQPVEEHQEIPKEEAAVMPVRGLRKRRRDRNLATERRQKPKGRIQASCESRVRLTVAGRKVSHREKWHGEKNNFSRNIQTQENCG